MNKIIVKRISWFILGVTPIGLIIGFSNTWTDFPSISIGGSSAVEPLSSALGNKYNDADVSVVAGGSSAGIKFAATSQKDIGNASTNPYQKVAESTISKDGWDKTTWTEKKMKTVTIAWDGIAIVYKPPSPGGQLTITNENIANLYKIFAGFEQVSFSELDPINYPSSNIYFSPYARTGGSSASGTASSFLTESSFTAGSKIPSNISKALKEGGYGKFTTTTSESNIESWNRIKSDSKTGSIIYLSLGFVKKNQSEIEKSGFKVASYKNENNNTAFNPWDQILDLTKNGYAWFSPLNSIFSLNSSTSAVQDFMWWIFTNNIAEKIIEEHSFIPLSIDYKKTMLLNSTANTDIASSRKIFFESSDIELAKERPTIHWYGAPK